MIIKFLRLKDIRSYNHAQIEFPKGKVLLSGDIGAGKSTILLSIEFALFGIKRGDITGTTLLRHGAKEGFVELNLEVDGKDVVIKRALKRASTGVKQTSGYIIIDGAKQDLTPEELKARVLELLGYPKSLLKKGKDLVYRFTVYTPQEHMKTILFESVDERLDTLRKVFGIDRYKNIRENALQYSSQLKSKRKLLEGKTFGLDEKIKARDFKKKEHVELKKKIDLLKPNVDEKQASLENLQKELKTIEEKVLVWQKMSNKIKLIEAQLMEKFMTRRRNNEQIEKTNQEINELEESLKNLSNDDFADKIDEYKKKIADSEEKLRSLNRNIAQHEVLVTNSKKVIEKIASISKCPTCEQDVNENHKSDIKEREQAIINENDKKSKELKETYSIISKDIEAFNVVISDLNKKQTHVEVMKERMKNLESKKIHLERLDKEQISLKKEIGALNKEKMDISRELDSSKNLEEEYSAMKNRFETERENERKISIEFSSMKTKYDESLKLIDLYEREIEQKKIFRQKIDKIDSVLSWFDKYFLNLMLVMEKNVMSQLYAEFNELFVEWFRILIEDETINVRLDDQFTPIIEQNGFETELNNLSGGEKTSVALAYRLALNKVINDFITHIKTRDIIMLDEPTDGFSDEQLDNVREVLDQINAKQIIIVSHESKVESFVDNVIEVTKQDHNSSIY